MPASCIAGKVGSIWGHVLPRYVIKASLLEGRLGKMGSEWIDACLFSLGRVLEVDPLDAALPGNLMALGCHRVEGAIG